MRETSSTAPPTDSSSKKPSFLKHWLLVDERSSGTNAVLARELRVALRNERSFATLAIFVAVLGAIVAAQFPADTAVGVAFNRETGSARLGTELFAWFGWSQATLIALLLPALATGALSQERERRTLEPLLLTPLSPLQIVWGKGAGVLAFAMLLLLATVPLTSLCFLLGGVSPGDVIGLYVCLLGLAATITALGLGCSAKWHNTSQATLMCYALMPLALIGLMIFSAPGIAIGGLGAIAHFGRCLARWWKNSQRRFALGKLKPLWNATLPFALIFLFVAAIWITAAGWEYGIFWIVFGLPYFALVSRWVMQWAADEVARRPEPRTPTPEKWNELKNEWTQAVTPPTVVALPTPTGKYTYTPQTPTSSAPTSSTRSDAGGATPTYGVKPFLPDGKNPIFQRDVRGALLGKMSNMARYSYVVVILSELALLSWMSSAANYGTRGLVQSFAGLASFHLLLLMTAGAIFGARSLAPEREQQTLPQLLTTPLLPREIIAGKFMAVGVWTFYVWMTAIPIALLLTFFGVISPLTLLAFLLLELAYGACAAAWGLFCSMRALTVRRALGWALGGVAALVVANSIAQTFWYDASTRGGNWSTGFYRASNAASRFDWQNFSTMFLPSASMRNAIGATEAILPAWMGWMALGSFLVFLLAALFFLWRTAADFKSYLQEI